MCTLLRELSQVLVVYCVSRVDTSISGYQCHKVNTPTTEKHIFLI